jgi:hypothetical protein
MPIQPFMALKRRLERDENKRLETVGWRLKTEKK